MDITIYHNSRCGTSRNTLAAIRDAGHEPQVVDYLATPPTREALRRMIGAFETRAHELYGNGSTGISSSSAQSAA